MHSEGTCTRAGPHRVLTAVGKVLQAVVGAAANVIPDSPREGNECLVLENPPHALQHLLQVVVQALRAQHAGIALRRRHVVRSPERGWHVLRGAFNDLLHPTGIIDHHVTDAVRCLDDCKAVDVADLFVQLCKVDTKGDGAAVHVTRGTCRGVRRRQW